MAAPAPPPAAAAAERAPRRRPRRWRRSLPKAPRLRWTAAAALIVLVGASLVAHPCEGAPPLPVEVEDAAAGNAAALIDGEERGRCSPSSSSGGDAGSSSTCVTEDDGGDGDDVATDTISGNDSSWDAPQLWDGPRDLFQRIFGVASTTATESEGSSEFEKNEEEGSNGDPFQGLAEGRHGPSSSKAPGFFEGLWGSDPSAASDGEKIATDDNQTPPPSDLFRAFQKLWGGGSADDTATNDSWESSSSSSSTTTVPGSAWEKALLTRFKTSQQTVLEESVGIKRERFQKAWADMSTQLRNTFSNVPIDRLNPLQVWYAMQNEESLKDPVWKRRQHRGLPDLKEEEAVALFDGLYLSYLSYVESCSDVHDGLDNFDGGTWVLVNCTTTGQPLQPAHFLAVKRQAQPAPTETNGWSFWNGGDATNKKRRVLEVVLVIRGTKELGDALSDALLEPATYRDGQAHHGILKSARWIVDTYREWIQHLREVSQSTHVKLWLVGHSLGAGTAALASMEFNGLGGSDGSTSASNKNNDGWEAHALGFGTPAVLSQELSESVQQYVTTVINDADCVPRMSGATLANGLLRILQYNWTDDALEDLRDALVAFKEGAPQSIADNFMPESAAEAFLGWVSSVLASMTRDLPVADASMRSHPVLFPPGDCVHLYRDGVDWKGSYVPCRRFDQLEAVRTLVDDHLIDTGYYVGLLGFVRALRKDLNWQFAHDLLKLPVR